MKTQQSFSFSFKHNQSDIRATVIQTLLDRKIQLISIVLPFTLALFAILTLTLGYSVVLEVALAPVLVIISLSIILYAVLYASSKAALNNPHLQDTWNYTIDNKGIMVTYPNAQVLHPFSHITKTNLTKKGLIISINKTSYVIIPSRAGEGDTLSEAKNYIDSHMSKKV